MKDFTPARGTADVKATKARWERTGVRCVYAALLRLALAPIVAVSAAAWCAACTYRMPVLGAGSKVRFPWFANSMKSITWKVFS